MDLDLLFKVAMEGAIEASQIVMEGREKCKELNVKKEKYYDVATQYDLKTEEYLIKKISDKFPDHKFISEETLGNEKLTDEPTWIIDPIDGTFNYIKGYPQFGIAIAFAFKKEILIGIVRNPLTNETYSAIKNRGAFCNGKQIKTTKTTDPKESIVNVELSLGMSDHFRDSYIKKFENCTRSILRLPQKLWCTFPQDLNHRLITFLSIRSIGSAEIGLCLVAAGVFDGFHVDHLKPWDFAAGSIIVTEAGGYVIGVDGGKFDFEKGEGIAASTEILARKLVDVFNV